MSFAETYESWLFLEKTCFVREETKYQLGVVILALNPNKEAGHGATKKVK